MTAPVRGHRRSIPPLASGLPFLLGGLGLVGVGLERGVTELLLAVVVAVVAGLAGGWWLFGVRRLRAQLGVTAPAARPQTVELETPARTVARFALPACVLAVVVIVVGLLLDSDLGVVLAAFGVAQLLDAGLVLAWERRHRHRLLVVSGDLWPVSR